jgi:putative CocE/NonD family hydrolase
MLKTHSRTLADLFAVPPAARFKHVRTTSEYLPMPDGVQIAVDVLLPADLPLGERLPAVLIMARYWRSMELRMPNPPKKAPIGPREPLPDYLIRRGFAVVVMDVRGSGASTGSSRYPWSPDEVADYGEVAAWVARQAWCNGHIGAVGISYEGATAIRLAALGIPSVRAVAPQEIEYDVYTDIAAPGGIFNAAFIRAWSESNAKLDSGKPSDLFPALARPMIKGPRPVDSDKASRAMLARALREHAANTDVFKAMSGITFRDDPFGETGATLDDFSLMPHQAGIEAGGAALFSWGSWLDGASADVVIRTFNTLSNPQVAVIGAWKHEMTKSGSPYQQPNAPPNPAQRDQWGALAQFFAETLIEGQAPHGKQLFYYTLGAETWKATDQFPLPGTQTQAWYFAPSGALTQSRPAAAAADSYKVDFAATTGRTNRWHTQMARPVIYPDRAKADRRLLTYTSAQLTHAVEITGYPVITLHVAANVEDCAFFVYLEDVDPGGVVRYLTEGQLRAIHRRLSPEPPPYWTGGPVHSFKRADSAPLQPGHVTEITFGLHPLSALIRAGHRLRVALAGADKDTFARVPTQGDPVWQVWHGGAAASRIDLPIVPR